MTPVPMMTYTKTGTRLTEGFERCVLVAYQDSAGVWTIGYGHTFQVHEHQTCSKEQAELWLRSDIEIASIIVNGRVVVPLTQPEFDALVDFTFNIGVSAFVKSTLLHLLNMGKYLEAAHELTKWDHVSGHILSGLLRRRVEELREFELGLRTTNIGPRIEDSGVASSFDLVDWLFR